MLILRLHPTLHVHFPLTPYSACWFPTHILCIHLHRTVQAILPTIARSATVQWQVASTTGQWVSSPSIGTVYL
jgi:hypothetical protein